MPATRRSTCILSPIAGSSRLWRQLSGLQGPFFWVWPPFRVSCAVWPVTSCSATPWQVRVLNVNRVFLPGHTSGLRLSTFTCGCPICPRGSCWGHIPELVLCMPAAVTNTRCHAWLLRFEGSVSIEAPRSGGLVPLVMYWICALPVPPVHNTLSCCCAGPPVVVRADALSRVVLYVWSHGQSRCWSLLQPHTHCAA